MPRKSAHISGMHGVFLVAAELSRRGFIVSPTSRGAAGADLLVTDESCQRAFSVQVKTNAGNSNFWLVGEKAKTIASPSHIYVLVNLNSGKTPPSFYVVPSEVLSQSVVVPEYGAKKTGWPSWNRDETHHDAWEVFGQPR